MRQLVVFSWAGIAAQLFVENTQITGQQKSVVKMLKNERSRTGIPAFGCFLAVEESPCGESVEAFCEKRTGAREIVLFPEGFEEPSRLAYSERPPRGGGGGGGAPEFDIV